MSSTAPGPADPWQVITDLAHALLDGDGAGARLRAVDVLSANGISLGTLEAGFKSWHGVQDARPAPASGATAGQAAREELEATFRRTFALHTNDFRAKYERARDAVMDAADAYAAAQDAQPAPEKPEVPGHPDDAAEEWLAEEFEPDDSPIGVSYERDTVIDAFRAGSHWARDQIAKFGKDENGRWITLEPQPAPGLAAAMARARDLLAALDEATRTMLNLGTRPAEINLAHRLRKNAGLAP